MLLSNTTESTMKLSVKILFPNLSALEGNYFKGVVEKVTVSEIVIYITKFSTSNKILTEKNHSDSEVLYGCCNISQRVLQNLKSTGKHINWLIIDQIPNSNYSIKELIINGKKIDTSECIVILYDYELVYKSEVKWKYEDTFFKLHALVKNENSSNISSKEELISCPSWLKSSMLLQHTISYINTVNWALTTIKRDKKISIRPGNFVLSILIDLLIGFTLLEVIKQDKKELSVFLMGLLERLINFLYSLLKWLMGAPAGLKLNNAFNKMLGKYFSYHVQLWWLFFDVTGEKLSVILDIYNYLGYLGFTFQAAVISDMISIVTFHSFCIYVYAARMFNIQISGLIALLRFFVGKKYNPLRDCIDSCEYSNQELFVGTVAFTILLLLLPTTAMYYIVFTLFRMLTLLVQHALAKLIYLMQTLPLYVAGLWLFRSPKVAGNILLEEIVDAKEHSPLFIKLKVFNKSLPYLIKHFCPPCDVPKELLWGKMLSNIFIGKPII